MNVSLHCAHTRDDRVTKSFILRYIYGHGIVVYGGVCALLCTDHGVVNTLSYFAAVVCAYGMRLRSCHMTHQDAIGS